MIDNILEPIIFWAWFLLVITSILYFFYTTLQHDMLIALKRLFYRVLLLGLVVIVSLNVVNASLIFINPHQVGIVISALSETGVREKPITAGRHWIFPLFEKVVIYPIGLQTYTMSGKTLEGQRIGDDSITARTKDEKEVNVDCSVTFRINPVQVIKLHEMWQDRYVDEFIRPILRSVIRTDISRYNIDDVNRDRYKLENTFKEHLEKEINRNNVKEKLKTGINKDEGLLVFERFFLRNLAFSDEYADALEKKHKAKVEAEAEADAIMLKAKAEAEAEAHAIVSKAKAEAKAEVEANIIKAMADEAKAKHILKE
jgi:regulator of protease activity HflC (stomatin/prohibitin superfamily)